MPDSMKELARDMIAMLRDLHENFGWDELHMTLDEIETRAGELGVEEEGE